jgi:hypothetical protein
MEINTSYTIFGSTYGCGAYGAGTYQNSSCASNGGGTTNDGSGGQLTNTGFDILLIATIAVALIFAGLVVRFWRRPKKTPDVTNS